MPESSVCHSGSAHRLPPPVALPHLCFIFLHSYYHTCYCMIHSCVHLFSVCLPKECKPWGRDSAHLVTAVCLPGEQHLETGGPSVFVAGLTGRAALSASPHYCQKYSFPYLLLSFLPLRNAQSPFHKPQTPISEAK